jgi:pimeloyl-ACP methyl ester carboxylesterase
LLIRRGRWCLFAVLALGIAAVPGRADVVILKDGYAIHGKVGTEQTIIFDKGGEAIVTRKMNALNTADDGARYTVFSPDYRRVGDVSTFNKYGDYVNFAIKWNRKTGYQFTDQMVLDKPAGEFNARWQRTLYFRSSIGVHHVEQQIDIITPHYVRIPSLTHQLTSYYLTDELGPELVRKLLASHPELVENGKPDIDKRVKLVRFLMQADWLNEAEEEVERLLKDIPGEAKRGEALQSEIRDLQMERLIAEIERAKEGGRHAFAQSAIRQIPRDKIPAKLALKLAGVKAEYEAATAKLDKAKRYLKELQGIAQRPSFVDLIDAADIILAEIHLDTASRLDLFIALAEQAATARKSGKTPLHKPEELLAAAISAWLMGNSATETSLSTARKRLYAREMALKFLRESTSLKRREMIGNYERDAQAIAFDELEKLISLLPPPEAEKDLSPNPVEKRTGAVPGVPSGVNYVLQLPPEYQHGRAYPLLILLPHGGERPADMLKGKRQKLADLAARYGFIIAIADWNGNGTQAHYGFTEDEQLMVTGLLWHLRRTLQVDSNRVFLFGLGEGANMALDLGATHPDLFAGIIPMSPSPDMQRFHIFEYWKNFQNLPVYMVVGDRAGDSVKTIRRILESWMAKGYPSIGVSYKGRGFEWYGEEFPYIFDWMGRKTRSTASPDLGRENEEYRTVTASANRFYWLSSDDIDPINLFDIQKKSRQFYPAIFKANVIEGNQIALKLRGPRQLSIWLAKGAVDFAKPVIVTINGTKSWKKELSPKISVLLEDLYDRGDRQRPFVQRIDAVNITGQVKFSAQ